MISTKIGVLLAFLLMVFSNYLSTATKVFNNTDNAQISQENPTTLSPDGLTFGKEILNSCCVALCSPSILMLFHFHSIPFYSKTPLLLSNMGFDLHVRDLPGHLPIDSTYGKCTSAPRQYTFVDHIGVSLQCHMASHILIPSLVSQFCRHLLLLVFVVQNQRSHVHQLW